MRRLEAVAATTLAVASGLAAWAAPRPLPPAVAVAVPIVWGGLLSYIPFRAAAWWAWREVRRAAPADEDRRALGVVLLLAFGLLIWGLDWGLTDWSFAADELRPDWVRDALSHRMGNGWHDKYPWLHYAVLAVPVSGFQMADRLGILSADSVVSWTAQLALMRVVSVLMAFGTLVGAFLCSAEMIGPRHAALAPLTLLLTPLFLYYGKMANLDVPALCWFSWAMVAYLRIRRTGELRDYVWLGVAAAGSVATKDQAYANLALVAAAAVVITARRQGATSWRAIVSTLVDRRIAAAAGAAALASVVLHNMVFNLDGFVSHVRLLSTFGDIGMVPRTAAGYVELTGLTLTLYRWAFGWPLFVLAVAGIGGASARRDRRWWLWLLVVPLSFHLCFTWVTLYVNDRYLMGGVFVLALFAGAACADWIDSVRWRTAKTLCVAVSMVFALLYASSINVMMSLDARRAVKTWLSASTSAETLVGLVGRNYMLRVGPPARAVFVEPTEESVRRASPNLLVMNARFAKRFLHARSSEVRAFLARLESGSLGYDEVLRYRARIPAWAILQYEVPFQRVEESLWTNLDKVNPEMVVYRRRGP